jgi:hypothetical protein
MGLQAKWFLKPAHVHTPPATSWTKEFAGREAWKWHVW